MLKLTPAQRSTLRSQAHGLSPVVMIGDAGLTPAVVNETDTALKAHGLIKVRVFGDDREARKLLVLYRPPLEKTKEPKPTRGKGPREVTIVTTHPTKRPTVKKVVLKGNERLTAGGNVRKAKTRQKSLKKNALGR